MTSDRQTPPARCRVCDYRLDPWLTRNGYATHPNCQTEPDVFGEHW